MFKKILVPVDGSELAEAVLPYIKQMALSPDTEVEVISVPASTPPAYAVEVPIDVQALLDYEYKLADQAAQQAATTLRDAGLKVSVYIGTGHVPTAILDRAEAIGADLIAMSTHGRSGVTRWLLGSTTDRVVHNSHIPVLLIRPPA